MMNWDKIAPWDYVVVSVAAEYHKKYNMVELDDIKQSLYEWFVSHPRKLSEWEALGARDAKNLLYRSLRNQALDYCQLWKAKSLGYETSDLFYYEPAIIEALLPAILMKQTSDAPQVNLGMPGRPPAPAEGGNLLAMMAEIRSGYDKLSVTDRQVLFYRYAESLDFVDIAKEMNLGTDDAARMRHNRAIKKLITRIGGFRPFLDLDATEEITEEPDELIGYDNSPSEYEGEQDGE